ncbi:MAG: asparagine synthetase A [Aigarchaeota archaeon]|nr:asparagine synthetase A [Candidatus Pelearchaeum maunauluense]
MLKPPIQELQTYYKTIRTRRMQLILKVQATTFRGIRDYLDNNGFTELLPPIIGPVTDPGIRGAKQVTIDYYGKEYKVMSSAILYKQMAAASLNKIYFFSPNVRLEPLETATTGRHLVEFVQVDIEEANITYEDAMRTAENLVAHIISYVVDEAAPYFEELGRTLRKFKPPFKKITHKEAVELLRSKGEKVSYYTEIPWEQEEKLSRMFDEPFFIIDYPKGARGFYDMEDDSRPGILRDFDMLYPEGYGEAISGAEREYRYEKVIARMRESGEDPAKYGWYLDMLREGIPPTAGFGIGVERLTRYLCGLSAVWEARPYPKIAGVYSP